MLSLTLSLMLSLKDKTRPKSSGQAGGMALHFHGSPLFSFSSNDLNHQIITLTFRVICLHSAQDAGDAAGIEAHKMSIFNTTRTGLTLKLPYRAKLRSRHLGPGHNFCSAHLTPLETKMMNYKKIAFSIYISSTTTCSKFPAFFLLQKCGS